MGDIIVSRSNFDDNDLNVNVPSDKSISHRILLLTSFQNSKAVIKNINMGSAVQILIPELEKIGVKFNYNHNDTLVVIPPLDWGDLKDITLNLGPSSAAARLLIGILTGYDVSIIVDGNTTLRNRPMEWVVEPLKEIGADITYMNKVGKLPVLIRKGNMHDGTVNINIGSAQAYSAVIFAAAKNRLNVSIRRQCHSRDHTERILEYLGLRINEDEKKIDVYSSNLEELREYVVPGDPSLAAYPAAFHVLSRKKSKLTLSNVCINKTRIGFFKILCEIGVNVEYKNVRNAFGEVIGDIIIQRTDSELKAFIINDDFLFHSMIDEIPLISVIATMINGRSSIYGADELRFKETDRIYSTFKMLRAFGADVVIDDNAIHITGGKKIKPSIVPSFNDHRISMSAAVLAASLEQASTIIDGTCYETSFVGFDKCMQLLGMEIKNEEMNNVI